MLLCRPGWENSSNDNGINNEVVYLCIAIMAHTSGLGLKRAGS